jgi:hypothetical protein
MPPLFIVLHLLLSFVCLAVVLRLPAGSRASKLFCLSVWLCVLFGYLLERQEDWGWAVMRMTTSDLPFLTNLTLEGAMALLGLMWRNAQAQNDRIRALVLSLPLVGATLFSYAWYFAPLPGGMTGKADRSGYCHQTTEDSCSAAAAVMLLSEKGILTDEAEMAALCLTRAGKGTSALGLMRGLMRKATSHGWQLRLITCTPMHLHSLDGPALLAVGLSPTSPAALADKMREFGWEPGQYHSVVVMGGDPTGKWLDVADPSYGREKWPAGHLSALWNGQALMLAEH